MTEDEVKVQKPKSPWLAAMAEALRGSQKTVEGLPRPPVIGSLISKFLIGDKPELLDNIAYGQGLTTGKDMAFKLRPATSELADFVPGAGTAKGVAMGAVGMRGLNFLGDRQLRLMALKLRDTLGMTKAGDKDLQREIIENTPGFFHVPRGTDFAPGFPKLEQFGYELPEGQLFRGSNLGDRASVRPLLDTYKHDRLEAAYPDLQSYQLKMDPSLPRNTARFSDSQKLITAGPHNTESGLLKAINHEVSGHFSAAREGWPRGTSLKYAKEQFDDLGEIHDLLRRFPSRAAIDPIKQPTMSQQKNLAWRLRYGRPDMKPGLAYEAYRREAGEQLAEALALSAAKGGGFVRQNFTRDPSSMYDWRALGKELGEYSNLSQP